VKRFVVPLVLLVGTIGLIPFALIAKARVTTMDKPRIHIVRDMDNQPKYKAQAENTLFLDGRAMRQPVPGAVARGELLEDDHYYRGQVVKGGQKAWAERFPEQVEVDEALLARGRERYDIYCAVCHGFAGGGDGMVDQRVKTRIVQGVSGMGGWATPANLHAEQIAGQPLGQLYNTIANGKANMPPYGAQVPVHDRWAIVAYVRALQRTQKP
jgi:mono/diheme cytochrome c family protein